MCHNVNTSGTSTRNQKLFCAREEGGGRQRTLVCRLIVPPSVPPPSNTGRPWWMNCGPWCLRTNTFTTNQRVRWKTRWKDVCWHVGLVWKVHAAGGIWYHFKPTYIILIPDLKFFCCIYLMNILIPFNFHVQIVIMFTNDYVFETFLRQEIVDYLSNGDFNCNFIQLFQWLVDLPLWLGHIFKPWNGFWRLTFTILKFLSYQPTPSKFWLNISHLGVIYEKKIEHCNNLIHWMPFDLMNDQKDMTNFFARDNLDTFALACEGSGHCLLRAPIFSILGKCINFRM